MYKYKMDDRDNCREAQTGIGWDCQGFSMSQTDGNWWSSDRMNRNNDKIRIYHKKL